MYRMKNKQVPFCTQPWSNLFLHNSGRIQPCCMNSSPLGDIYTDSIDDIWNNDRIQHIRDMVIQKKYKHAGCKAGCPVRHKVEYDTQLQIFPEKFQIEKEQNNRMGKNLREFQECIEKKSLRAKHLPIYIDIQPLEGCNMACIMCHQKHGKKESIPSKILESFLNEADAIHTLRFQGGEIFLDSKIVTFLSKLKKRLQPYQQIEIITNGSLLTEVDIQELTSPPNPIHFVISIDSIDAITYQKIRHSPLFNQVWKTLSLMANIQKEQGRKDIVRWNFVVMKSNFHQLKDAILKASELGVDVAFQPIIGAYPKENIFNYPEIRPEHAFEYIGECMLLASELSFPVTTLKIVQQKLQSCCPI